MVSFKKYGTILVAALLLPLLSYAQEKSKLELGLGFAYLSFPEYAGSKIQENRVFPFPYIQYKSDLLNIEKNRAYAKFFESDRLFIDVSVGGHIPVSKSDDSLRSGMRELDASLEIGPQFNYRFLKEEHLHVTFELPVRMVVMSDFSSIEHHGYVGGAHLHAAWKYGDLEIDLGSGVSVGSKEYYRYYYDVDSTDVTAQRPEYHTKGGFGGVHSSFALTYRDGDLWYGSFIKHRQLHNAVFDDSPLVAKKTSDIYGFAMSYIF
jgi:outer membrane protein